MLVVGAGIGVSVTNYVLKNNYSNIVQAYSDDLFDNVDNKKESESIEKPRLVNTDLADIQHPLDDDEEVVEKNYLVANKEPYFIEYYQYHEERKTYEKVELVLYQDLALVDEGEELLHIETIFKSLSPEVTKLFEFDTLYIRDDSISTDYEVIKSAKLYSEYNN